MILYRLCSGDLFNHKEQRLAIKITVGHNSTKEADFLIAQPSLLTTSLAAFLITGLEVLIELILDCILEQLARLRVSSVEMCFLMSCEVRALSKSFLTWGKPALVRLFPCMSSNVSLQIKI
jgi:hypothetical protein